MRWYSFIPENSDSCKMIYQRKCPPNNSVYECWTTVGIENDGAQIIFIEYDFYDKDPDGVREAYECMYDSVYNITVDTSKIDTEKLFVYTVTKDGSLISGFDINMKNSRLIIILTEPKNFDNNFLINLSNRIETNKSNIQQIINQTFFKNTIPYLIILNDRM